MVRKRRNLKIKAMSHVQLAYLAGLIDGEGSITVTRKRDTKGMRFGYNFRPVVHVASTNRAVLHRVWKWTGRLGKVGKFDEPRANRKARYQWMIWSRQGSQLVRAVLPYLIVKRRQALAFLRFANLTRSCRSPSRNGLTDVQWRRQHELYAEIRKLNKRGP